MDPAADAVALAVTGIRPASSAVFLQSIPTETGEATPGSRELYGTRLGLDCQIGDMPMGSSKRCAYNKLASDESRPEKAGVGGSIPSLATISLF